MIVLGVGIASKPFVIEGLTYLLVAYESPYQSSYFLMDTVTVLDQYSGIGRPVARLAYENGGGYLSNGIPSVYVNGNVASIGYLYKDLIEAVNKGTNLPSGTQINGIYSQTGINIANFTLGTAATIAVSEIGNNLNITGGFLWGYDGVTAVEN